MQEVINTSMIMTLTGRIITVLSGIYKKFIIMRVSLLLEQAARMRVTGRGMYLAITSTHKQKLSR